MNKEEKKGVGEGEDFKAIRNFEGKHGIKPLLCNRTSCFSFDSPDASRQEGALEQDREHV